MLLSACMMVRNEEEQLARCLSSIRDVVDEIVVVDTGSTDRTMEIGRSFGARVYEHPWRDDFSVHRNQSLSYAAGKWCLIIDADEELTHPGRKRLAGWLRRVESRYSTIAVRVTDIQRNRPVNQFNSLRIFQRGTITYRGIVHNMADCASPAALCPHLGIRHYGYDLSPERMKAKKERTWNLLQERLRRDPEDWQAYFYLCQIHDDAGRHEEAVTCYEIYLAHKADNKDFNPSVYFSAVKTFLKLGNYEKAREWLKAGLDEMPDDLDLTYAAVEYALAVKDPGTLVDGCQRFERIYRDMDRQGEISQCRFVYTHGSRELAHCLFHLVVTRMEQGVGAMNRLLALMPELDDITRKSTEKDLERELKRIGASWLCEKGETHVRHESI